MADELLWLDLEMTGLDTARHVIVEIATLITDTALNVLAEGPDLVIHASETELERMDDEVREMHTQSGLLAAIRRSALTTAEAETRTLAFIAAHLPDDYQPPLAGNSIGTDRRFLLAQMPALAARLHYRVVDVSTVKELCRRWYPGVLDAAPPKRETHRALDDIRESIGELQYYRQAIFRAPEDLNG